MIDKSQIHMEPEIQIEKNKEEEALQQPPQVQA